jgi:type II secretory pathway component GspD/PulD (secretin)
VAKLALHRPLASLGLVGILESRSSLRQRIERLMDFRPPRRAGLGLASAIGVLGFAALAVPMGEAPAPTAGSGLAAPQVVTNSSPSETSSSAGLLTEHPPPYVRAFKVDPNTLLDGLGVAKGPVGTNELGAILPALRNRLARAGVDLDPTTNAGKAIFYSDRQGMLMVRATLQDLHIVERVLAELNTAPPQINIKARFVEVSRNDTQVLGFDWYLGNMLTDNGSTDRQVGTAPSSNGLPSPTQPAGVFPGKPSAGTNGQLLTSGPPSVGSPLFTLTGILTEPQYRMVLKALEQREGTELIAQPEITTGSGRQVQCKTTDIRSVVKGINEQALTPPGITSTNDDESSVYGIERMEFGVILDVIPTVLQDGYTINLPVVVTLLEFLGYEDTRTNRVAVYVNGQQKWVSPPGPIVQARQMTSTVNVWDGQTLVLGGLVSERIVTMKDGVPVLGELPLVGGLFRRESKNTQKRNLLVFITPTIIDPAGNRVHAAGDMPFTRDGIPPQPPR